MGYQMVTGRNRTLFRFQAILTLKVQASAVILWFTKSYLIMHLKILRMTNSEHLFLQVRQKRGETIFLQENSSFKILNIRKAPKHLHEVKAARSLSVISSFRSSSQKVLVIIMFLFPNGSLFYLQPTQRKISPLCFSTILAHPARGVTWQYIVLTTNISFFILCFYVLKISWKTLPFYLRDLDGKFCSYAD